MWHISYYYCCYIVVMLKHHWFIVKVLPKGVQGLAAHCSKANKQARLMEREVCFISDAGNLAGRADICPKANTQAPALATSGARAFIERGRAGRGGRVTCRGSAVSICLRPNLTSVPAHVLGALWSPRS